MAGLLRALLVCAPLYGVAATANAASVETIVDRYARSAVENGQTVGIGVAVIAPGAAPQFFGYGHAVAPTGSENGKRFKPDTLIGIGSVTKVFTTNLLGQAVARDELSLDTKLSAFEGQTGPLRAKMGRVTLRDLGDFTGGITDYAPLCSTPNPPPGCLPNIRPPITQYNGKDFARYFRHATPLNYQANPPSETKLPAPYFYSDYGIGYLGLLIAGDKHPMSNRTLDRWQSRLTNRLLKPLKMHDTFLEVPASKADRRAAGYNTALAAAEVTNGAISAITLIARGGAYSAPPQVTIVGGGGQGASAAATLNGGAVRQINVTAGGSGYVAPPKVVFSNGGSTTEATAQAIVRGGRLVAIAVAGGGAGYQRVPNVTITGGRVGGTNAAATAHLVNGRVGYVSVDDPGSGYVDPLAVIVAPGNPIEDAIPIWAPAGALTTSLQDLAKFARAAMKDQSAGKLDPIIEGFRIAERAHACTGPDPELSTCPAGAMRSGLAWAVQPADLTDLVPTVVSKDGGIGGVSAYVALMPSLKLGVVVLSNDRQTLFATDKPTGVAGKVANNILYALFYDSRHRRSAGR